MWCEKEILMHSIGAGMIKIGICDDSEAIIQLMEKLVNQYLTERRIVAEITLYDQSRMLQYDIEEGRHFDLILSDIEMPYVDGMKIARYIRVHLPDTLIIFVTSYLKYTLDAFELSIFRYIPKKDLTNKLSKALDDAFDLIGLQTEMFYVISGGSRYEKIAYKRIISIQKEGKNSVFSLTDGSRIKQRKSLAKVYEELDGSDFAYVDRGVIINLSHIISIRDGKVIMEDGDIIFGSRAKLELLTKELQHFWGKTI